MLRIDKYFELGKEITEKAGEYLLDNVESIHKVTHKTENHYGIEADVELNEIYEKFFRKKTPNISLYTEEGEKNLTNGLVWVVDPIEGTSNYRVKLPFYATQLCLLYEKSPLVSFVNAPGLKMFFSAIKGKGAFLNEKRIKISNVTRLEESLFSINKGTKKQDLIWYGDTVVRVMDKVRTFRHFGACGLEMAATAAGMIDVFICNGAHSIYDYSPGSLIVKEAGGEVRNFEGKNWGIEDSTIIATNHGLMKKMIEVLK